MVLCWKLYWQTPVSAAIGIGKRSLLNRFKVVLAGLLDKMAFTCHCRHVGVLYQFVGWVVVAAERSKRERQIVITQSCSDKGTDTEHNSVKAIRLIYGQ